MDFAKFQENRFRIDGEISEKIPRASGARLLFYMFVPFLSRLFRIFCEDRGGAAESPQGSKLD